MSISYTDELRRALWSCLGLSGAALRRLVHLPDEERRSTRQAVTGVSVKGRPFLVQGDARLAEAVERHDWLAEPPAHKRGAGRLSSRQLKRVALYWQNVGLMEHASIGAFARFSLQLLSLGAPAELLEATHHALIDETLHARLAFDLATRFGGRAVGPGPLNIESSLESSDWSKIVRNTVLEGCIGETVAALAAEESKKLADDEGVSVTLDRIAVDEQRHAELAWHFVRWSLEQRPELATGVLVTVRQQYALAQAALDELAAPPSRVSAVASYGLLTDAQQTRLRAEALAEVVLPCASALCEPHLQEPLDRPDSADSPLTPLVS